MERYPFFFKNHNSPIKFKWNPRKPQKIPKIYGRNPLPLPPFPKDYTQLKGHLFLIPYSLYDINHELKALGISFCVSLIKVSQQSNLCEKCLS